MFWKHKLWFRIKKHVWLIEALLNTAKSSLSWFFFSQSFRSFLHGPCFAFWTENCAVFEKQAHTPNYIFVTEQTFQAQRSYDIYSNLNPLNLIFNLPNGSGIVQSLWLTFQIFSFMTFNLIIPQAAFTLHCIFTPADRHA